MNVSHSTDYIIYPSKKKVPYACTEVYSTEVWYQTRKERHVIACLSSQIGKFNFTLLPKFSSVHVYVVIISKYATKIVGMQNRQVACVHGTQYQKQLTFSKFKPPQ